MKLQGVYTALVTPFNLDGTIDEKALRELVDFQVAEGISGLVPVGTTGESPTLTHDEHHRVIELVTEQTAGRVPVIAGTGSNSTEEAIRLTKHAKGAGVDYTLQVAPYYNKPSQEGFYRHFCALADAVDLPVIIYNIPGRTGKNIENSTMLRLAKHPGIIGVKEASGDLSQMMEIIAHTDDDFAVFSGDDNLGLPLIAAGGDGIISVAANIIPAAMEEMVKALLEGRMEDGRALHYRFFSFFKGMFLDTNPIPVKYALSRVGRVIESYRLPLCPMEDQLKTQLDRIMEDLKIIA